MAHFSLSRHCRCTLRAAGFALLAASGPALFAQINTPSSKDGFDPNVTGIVNLTAVQPNGQILVAGSFSGLSPNGAVTPTTLYNLARLNADGSIDTTFVPQPNAQVLALALEPNGQILIGGSFTSVQPNGAASPTTRNYIARLNADGSLDATFNPNPRGARVSQVNAICVEPNGQILIGGTFNTLQPNGASSPTTCNYIARLNADGSLDTTFNPNPNSQVTAIFVQPNGKILVGGAFATLQPNGAAAATAAPYVVRLNADGSIDPTFVNPGLNGQVLAINAQVDGEILLGGQFITMLPAALAAAGDGAANVDHIVRLNPNGSQDATFLTNVVGPVQQILIQTDGRILICGNITTITNGTSAFFNATYIARLNRDGTPDTTFNPNPNYFVYGMALQTNGEIVIGGAFTQIQPNGDPAPTVRNGLARINPDGSLDEDFSPNAFGGVGVMITQANGQILVGGNFSSVDGVTRTNLARISATGTLDTTFAPIINGAVFAIALQSNGQILIGGNFTSVNSVPIQYLARLNSDGTLDTGFMPNPNSGGVYAIVVQPNGKILIGGNFYGFGPAIGPPSATSASITYLGRINTDGSIDTTFQPDPNGTVYSIIYNASSNTIVFAGAFTAVQPIDFTNFQEGQYLAYTWPAPFIALVGASNGLDYNSWLPNPNGQVDQIAMEPDGKILLVGSFTQMQPNPITTTQAINGVETTITAPVYVRDYIARINFADGSLDQNFAPQANAPVLTVAVNPSNSQIVVGGTFTSITGSTSTSATARNYIARLNSDGSVDAGFATSLNGPVDTVQYLANSQFLVGGSFTTALPLGASSTVPAVHIMIFNGDGSVDAALESPFQPAPLVTCLAVEPDTKVLFGGNFINAAGVYATNIASFNADGSQDNTFYANANGQVNSIVVQTDGTFFVGGSFSAIGTGLANNFAHLNPGSTLDTTYSNFPDGPVNAIAAQANVPAVIGGAFAHVGGIALANLARINTNGSVDTTFAPNPNSTVSAVSTEPNGQYLVGGAFTAIAGTPRNYLARLNANGSLDATFNPNPNGAVGVILIQPDGKILIGGNFTTVGASGRGYIARLNADGSLDTTFNPGANGAVSTMGLQAPGYGAPTSQNGSSVDQILVGGSFTSIAGTARNYLARLNYDGSIDATFNPSPDNVVSALAIQADGKPVVAGAFGNVGGLPRNGLARLANPAAAIQSLAVSPDLSTLTWSLAGGPELSNATFEMSTDDASWVTIGFGSRVGTANTWRLANLASLPANTVFYVQVLGQSFTSQGSSTSIIGTVQQFNVTPVPVIKSSAAASAAAGTPFYYEIAATNTPTSYSATGLPSGLSFNSSTGVISGTPTQTGTYTVALSATTTGGTATGSVVITVAASGSSGSPVAPLARLINLSTRSYVNTSNPLVAGFAIGGSGPKTVLLRAVGPGLASPPFNLPGALSNPYLQLYGSNGQLILENKGWDGSGTIMQIFAEFGAFPLVVGSADSAAVTTLTPGAYTMQVIDGAGTGGTALAEIYDADSNSAALTQRFVNISGRGQVTGGNVIIGGFVITGSGPKNVLLRGVGPGLTAFGVPGALSAPVLALYDNQNNLLAQNSAWGTPNTVNASYPAASSSTIAADAAIAGAFALGAGSADASIVVSLPPGIYTGQITGAGGQTGVALLEIYELP